MTLLLVTHPRDTKPGTTPHRIMIEHLLTVCQVQEIEHLGPGLLG